MMEKPEWFAAFTDESNLHTQAASAALKDMLVVWPGVAADTIREDTKHICEAFANMGETIANALPSNAFISATERILQLNKAGVCPKTMIKLLQIEGYTMDHVISDVIVRERRQAQ